MIPPINITGPIVDANGKEVIQYFRIIIPTGSASGVVNRAWLNVSTAGGGGVKAWFQKSADSDGPPPGAGTPWESYGDFIRYKNSARPNGQIPDGTEFIEIQLLPRGPGQILVECEAK